MPLFRRSHQVGIDPLVVDKVDRWIEDNVITILDAFVDLDAGAEVPNLMNFVKMNGAVLDHCDT